MDDPLQQLSREIIAGNKEACENLTRSLLAAGLTARKILDLGLVAGMDVVGTCFRDNIIFLPEVLVSARAMKSSLDILEPMLAESNEKRMGTVVIGTVKGDIHDIGKNIVVIMLRGAGFNVIDLGIDTRVEKFVETVQREHADILGLSAMLTTTMGYMKTVVERIKADGIPVKTLIGGAPVSQTFAETIGADVYAGNAADAVEKAKLLIAK